VSGQVGAAIDEEARTLPRVRVRLFALARERAGRAELDIDLPDRATVGDLRRALTEHHPSLSSLLPSAMVAVDAEYASDDRELSSASDVAIIPPVSGGGLVGFATEVSCRPRVGR
jgi:molybdopterin converting factor subunit 1